MRTGRRWLAEGWRAGGWRFVLTLVLTAVAMAGACAGGVVVLINHPPPPAAVVLFAMFVALALWVHRWTLAEDDAPADIHDVVCEHCCGWIADGGATCCDAAGTADDDATASRC